MKGGMKNMIKKDNSRFDSVIELITSSKSKRSQAQIITTVLIILLVLAAIVIVWQVVQNTITRGAEQVETQVDCSGINLVIESASQSAKTVDVRRLNGGPSGGVGVYALPEGVTATQEAGANLEVLGTYQIINVAIGGVGDTVQVGAILSDGTICPALASSKAVA